VLEDPCGGGGQSGLHGPGLGRGVGVGLACAGRTAVMLMAAMNSSKQKINLIPSVIYTVIAQRVSIAIGGNTYKFGNAVGDGRGSGQPRGHRGRGVGVCLVCAEITAVMLITAMNHSNRKINLIPAAISTAIA